jgi:hypothetical protein
MNPTYAEADIAAIGSELLTQDSACTSHPMYVVFNTKRVYGIDPQWCDPVWVDTEDYIEADAHQTRVLDRYKRIYDREPRQWINTGFFEREDFVTLFFTKKAADQFVIDNKHRWDRLHVYVDSFHRNSEIIGIRNFMTSLAKVVGCR